jgi:hypothetical protein
MSPTSFGCRSRFPRRSKARSSPASFDCFEITGDECHDEISLPLANYLALVKRSRTLVELRILLFEWSSAEEKTRTASA